MPAAKDVDDYIASRPEWSSVLDALRRLLLASGLDETIKWGAPCYTRGGKNLVGIAAMKKHCALWFHQGALLDDPLGVLVNAQKGKTKALRQWRFEPGDTVDEAGVASYIAETIERHDRGEAIAVAKPTKAAPQDLPAELTAALKQDAKARATFAALTPGRQREYAEHIASAKREATRASRAEKALPLIRAGQGLNDKYKC